MPVDIRMASLSWLGDEIVKIICSWLPAVPINFMHLRSTDRRRHKAIESCFFDVLLSRPSHAYPVIAAGALRALGRIAACGDVRMMAVAREQMERSSAEISMAAVRAYCRMVPVQVDGCRVIWALPAEIAGFVPRGMQVESRPFRIRSNEQQWQMSYYPQCQWGLTGKRALYLTSMQDGIFTCTFQVDNASACYTVRFQPVVALGFGYFRFIASSERCN